MKNTLEWVKSTCTIIGLRGLSLNIQFLIPKLDVVSFVEYILVTVPNCFPSLIWFGMQVVEKAKELS